MKDSLFVTCARGLEDILAEELEIFLQTQPILDKGGVHVNGSLKEIYQINLLTRIGMHVLKPIFELKSTNIDQLYNIVKSFNWSKIITKDETLSIRTRINSTLFKNSNIVTLKIKDAIVDRIRQETQARPSIDKNNPTYQFFVNVKQNHVKIYLNTSGEPLYKRGYRTKIHRAALNPCMAAALIKISKWDEKIPFYDPMCGSGTIPIEAAMIAHSIPPRLKRKSYAFKNWSSFNHNLFEDCRKEAINKINYESETSIYASDNTEKNLGLIANSMKILNLTNKINLSVKDIVEFAPAANEGIVITNPPHGHRMSRELALKRLYRNLGDVLKNKCNNHDAYIFSMNNVLSKCIGLRTKRKYVLKNGKLDCRLLYYPIKAGKFH